MARAKGPKRVTAYQGWAIFADYDGNAPDTKDLILVATEELAKQVCDKLNENPRAYGSLAFVDGCEYCKTFATHHAVSTRKDDFATTFEKAFEDVEYENDEEYDEGS